MSVDVSSLFSLFMEFLPTAISVGFAYKLYKMYDEKKDLRKYPKRVVILLLLMFVLFIDFAVGEIVALKCK